MLKAVDSFLLKSGYKSIGLVLDSQGDYMPKDSEWNYSDVLHLEYVHARVLGISLVCDVKHTTSLLIQRIGPFAFPAPLHVVHEEHDCHEYLVAILSLVISIRTKHEPRSGGGCLTTTAYKFYFRDPISRLLAWLARWSARRNYQILMSEDLPMRQQRHRLREMGIVFAYDKKPLIGFSDTLDIAENHVDASNLCPAGTNIAIDLVGELGKCQLPELLLSIAWNQEVVTIWPLICPHEGAPLSACLSDVTTPIQCPWHGRRLLPLVAFSRTRIGSCYDVNLCELQIQLRLNEGDGGRVWLELSSRPKSPES